MKKLESLVQDVTIVMKEGNLEPVQTELKEMPLQPRRRAARAGKQRRRLLINA